MTDNLSPSTTLQLADLYDAYCERFIQLNPALEYRVAESRAEREAHFRLRYERVIMAGWAVPTDFPDGLEQDEYDDAAAIINGWAGDTLVVSGRLIFPAKGRLLPMEADFDFRAEPKGQVVEAGRTVLVHALQKTYPLALLGLIGASWHVGRKHGYCEHGGVLTAAMVRLYRLMGLHMSKLSEPKLHWGEMRAPCTLNLAATIQDFQSRRLYLE